MNERNISWSMLLNLLGLIKRKNLKTTVYALLRLEMSGLFSIIWIILGTFVHRSVIVYPDEG